MNKKLDDNIIIITISFLLFHELCNMIFYPINFNFIYSDSLLFVFFEILKFLIVNLIIYNIKNKKIKKIIIILQIFIYNYGFNLYFFAISDYYHKFIKKNNIKGHILLIINIVVYILISYFFLNNTIKFILLLILSIQLANKKYNKDSIFKYFQLLGMTVLVYGNFYSNGPLQFINSNELLLSSILTIFVLISIYVQKKEKFYKNNFYIIIILLLNYFILYLFIPKYVVYIIAILYYINENRKVLNDKK